MSPATFASGRRHRRSSSRGIRRAGAALVARSGDDVDRSGCTTWPPLLFDENVGSESLLTRLSASLALRETTLRLPFPGKGVVQRPLPIDSAHRISED